MAMNKREREYVSDLEAKAAQLEALLQEQQPKPDMLQAVEDNWPEGIVGYHYNLHRVLTGYSSRPSADVEFAAIKRNSFYCSSDKRHVQAFLEGKNYGSRNTERGIYKSRKEALQAMRYDVHKAMTAKLAEIDVALAEASDAPLTFGE